MSHDRHAFSVAGNLALGLLNTRLPQDGHGLDLLTSPSGLASWLQAVGLVEAKELPLDPPVARALLTEAHRLRDHVADLVTACQTGTAPPDHALFGVNRVLGARRITLSLSGGDDGLRFSEHAEGRDPLGVLAPVALAAGRLVLEVSPSRIRRCAAEGCRRWFLDTSKGGRRKWCSMAVCGNRAKAEGHRRRRRSD